MRSITKRFPGVVALDRVDFTVRRGEIHSLIGQNGAGKSTLMNILSGVYPADAGEILIDGELVVIGHPRDALRLGIGTVYQELSLLPNLSVADNIFLGREAGNGFVVDEKSVLTKPRPSWNSSASTTLTSGHASAISFHRKPVAIANVIHTSLESP